MANDVQLWKANSIQEILYHLNNINGLEVFGGGTSLIYNADNENTVLLPKNCLFITCNECSLIDKKERHIDFGAAVTLSQVLQLDKNKIPSYFFDAILTVANPLIRNVATIPGNICTKNFYNSLYSPLLAVDAKLEIRSITETKTIPLTKFIGLEKGQFISKIRLPLIDWDISIYKKLGPANTLIDVSASYTFLAKNQKDVLTDLRIAFCGLIKFRSIELENKLIGSRLPLSKKAIDNMIDSAQILYDNEVSSFAHSLHPMLKEQFLNLLKTSLLLLT